MYENPYMGNQYMQQIPRYNGMQYQQMQQPVYQNPVQQAPTQQQAAVPQLIGRTVNSVDEITANDVPMNYPYAIFPKNDLSEVYLKSWTPNGTIQTITFKPEINTTPNNTNSQESVLRKNMEMMKEDGTMMNGAILLEDLPQKEEVCVEDSTRLLTGI